jgi:hypothetical protein
LITFLIYLKPVVSGLNWTPLLFYLRVIETETFCKILGALIKLEINNKVKELEKIFYFILKKQYLKVN